MQPLHSFFVSKIDKYASEASLGETREPVGLVVIKSPAVFILIREIDDLQRENTSMISKEQESLCEFYRGHFCLGNPRGRVVFINKFVGRHENLFIANIL